MSNEDSSSPPIPAARGQMKQSNTAKGMPSMTHSIATMNSRSPTPVLSTVLAPESSSYYPMSWLARGGVDPRREVMAVIRAYFDASGLQGEQYVVVGASAATVDTWDEFSSEWDAVLASESITEFHMTDCNSSKGEFLGWDRERRDHFRERLLQVMSSHRLVFTTAILELTTFNKMNSFFMIEEEVGGQFAYCMRGLLELMRNSEEIRALPHEEFQGYFVPGDIGDGDLVSLVRKKRDLFPGELQFRPQAKCTLAANGDRRYLRGYEASDLIAWEDRVRVKRYREAEAAGENPLAMKDRRHLKTIYESAGSKCHVFTEAGIGEACMRAGIPRRIFP